MEQAWTRHENLFDADEYECPVCGTRFDTVRTYCPECGEAVSGNVEVSPDYIEECAHLETILGNQN